MKVFMIHGAFCGGWAFEQFRQPFEAAGFEVVCPDLRHHGEDARKLPHPELGTLSLTDFARDLEQQIAANPDTGEQSDQRPYLIGHSMGGLLCQMLAARGLARAVALLAPSPPWGVLPSTHWEVLSAQGLYLTGQFWSQPLYPNFHMSAEHALDRLAPEDQRRIFSRFVPESGRAMFEILHWPADTARASAVAARSVRCPVLCLTGSRDRVNPPGTVRRVAARYGGTARFLELPELSHWLVGEPGWERAATTCLDWFAGLDRDA